MKGYHYLENVAIITTDGRNFVGTLKGYDQTTNIILANTKERIISPDEPTEIIELGLYLLRGESVAVCGLIDDEIDKKIDWSNVRGQTIGTTKHSV